MLIISYDIADDKVRTKFSKYLSKYGYRLQYSVFRIKNSNRILELIQEDIKNTFEKQFSESDSVLIYRVDENTTITFGYARHEDDDLLIL